MNRNNIILVVMILFSSLLLGAKKEDKQATNLLKKKEGYFDIAHKKNHQYGLQIAKKYKFELVGVGGGNRDFLEFLSLSFATINAHDIDSLRSIFIDITSGLLNLINRDKKIRPYLLNYPFTLKNLHITILNVCDNAPHQTIVSVFSIKEKIEYWSNDSIVHTETYQEALKIIESKLTSQQVEISSRVSGSCTEDKENQ